MVDHEHHCNYWFGDGHRIVWQPGNMGDDPRSHSHGAVRFHNCLDGPFNLRGILRGLILRHGERCLARWHYWQFK